MNIPIASAMLCYNPVFDPPLSDGREPGLAKVVWWPDRAGHSDAYGMTVGACFSAFGQRDTNGKKFQLLIDAWHAAAFYNVPIENLHQALLVVPEYRAMLAEDCLPKEFRHEREELAG